MRPQPDNGRTQHETNDESYAKTNGENYAKTNGENYAETNEWLTVANAARFLGVTKQAIRQRIYRDTIPHRKASDGTVHVRITEDNPEANGESYGETHAENLGNTEAVNRELVDELRDRVGFLERQLEGEQRAHAELRRIIAGLVQRVPELEPAREATAETPDSPETASAPPEEHKAPPEQERRSWWRKVFGA